MVCSNQLSERRIQSFRRLCDLNNSICGIPKIRNAAARLYNAKQGLHDAIFSLYLRWFAHCPEFIVQPPAAPHLVNGIIASARFTILSSLLMQCTNAYNMHICKCAYMCMYVCICICMYVYMFMPSLMTPSTPRAHGHLSIRVNGVELKQRNNSFVRITSTRVCYAPNRSNL